MFSKASSPDQRLKNYDHLIIHVTATGPNSDIDDRDVDRMHRARGFNGCGYHAIIKRDGTWLDHDNGAMTRPMNVTGAHVGGCGPGWNRRSFGVSMVGGVDSQNRPENNMTTAQFDTLQAGITRFLSLHPKGPGGVTVMGHRDLIAKTDAPVKKACPCFDAVEWWNGVKDGAAPHLTSEEEDEFATNSLVDQPAFWTVASGDTVSRIASVTGVSLAEIAQLNPEITDINLISIGQVIRLRH